MAKLTFVCWGNICRSPMGEQVARAWAQRYGLDVEIDSAGISSEELGNPIDRRAARMLREHGYSSGSHRAKQADRRLVDESDLVLAFEPLHLARLQRLRPDADHIRLVTDFDPDAPQGSGIPDPWYGSAADFKITLDAIEAAMPGIIDALRDLDGHRPSTDG